MSRIQGRRFSWADLKPRDEPSRHRLFWVGVLVALGVATPWWWKFLPFGEQLVAGLPLWVVTVLGCCVVLSCTIAFSALRWWGDAEPDDWLDASEDSAR